MQPVSGAISCLSLVNSAHPALERRVVKVWGQQGAIKGQERSRALAGLEANRIEVPFQLAETYSLIIIFLIVGSD